MFSKNLIRKYNLVNSFCSSKFKRQSYRRFLTNVVERKRKLTGEWETVVGLEVHAQISAASKLFSGSGTEFSSPINSQVSFFDAALPGTLPVLNKRCVEAAVLTALALKCHINKTSLFDRKHYFYADLPAGYQITQQRLPLAKNGKLPFIVVNAPEPYFHESRVIQLQLEQDSGRSLHDADFGISLIDLNRAGMALMEIVFDADLSNGEEAAAVVEELQYLLCSLGTCDGKMEEGSLRVDANVSINRPGEPWGTRTEIKNINSAKSVAKAIDYEIKRQIHVIENGKIIENETRMFNADLRVTVPMRDKETQQDYRFMPEPNLPPLRLLQDQMENVPDAISISEIAKKLPSHLPFDLRKELAEKHKLSWKTADSLIKQENLLQYYTEIHAAGKRDARLVVNFLINDVYTALNKKNITLKECSVSPSKLGEIIDLHAKKKISSSNKLELLEMLIDGDNRTVSEIVTSKQWNVIDNQEEIEKIIKQIIEQNPKLVEKCKTKPKTENAILGMVRKSTSSQLDMALASRILRKLLAK